MHRLRITLLATALLAATPALAQVGADQVARLGQDLTPLGAEKAGNAAGTIPAWDGGLAKNSADAILLADDLSRLLAARALALRTRKIIKENFAWSIGYNLLVLPLAASGWLPPYLAAAGMSLSSLIVVTNSMRLNR